MHVKKLTPQNPITGEQEVFSKEFFELIQLLAGSLSPEEIQSAQILANQLGILCKGQDARLVVLANVGVLNSVMRQFSEFTAALIKQRPN